MLMPNLSVGDKLGSFLRQFPDFPNAFLIGGAADIFVTELADQVRQDLQHPKSFPLPVFVLIYIYVVSFKN